MSSFVPKLAWSNEGPYLVDPLYAFSFLQTFVDILQEYFGHLSAETLKDNFDVVYQVCLSGPFRDHGNGHDSVAPGRNPRCRRTPPHDLP